MLLSFAESLQIIALSNDNGPLFLIALQQIIDIPIADTTLLMNEQ